MKILNPRVHGYIDFLVVALFALAPSLFDFSSTPAKLSYIIAGIHLAMSLITAYPLGILKLVPFTVHGALEFVVALVLIALPWISGFAVETAARNFYIAGGIAVFLVVLMTEYKAAARTHTLTPSRIAR